ncbi:MAG: hypothetical protein E7218_06530 [Anaerofustis stercorihominis]|nr:hypothetical protein [Anaerofustis stercorihominis]
MNDNESKSTFLLDCMKENLAHARHIENERHTFFSLYLVAVGLVLGDILLTHTSGVDIPRIIVCALMIMLHAVVKNLFHRWNRAYKSHMKNAKKLRDEYMQITGISFGEVGKDEYYYYPDSIDDQDYYIGAGEYMKKFREIMRPVKKDDNGNVNRADIKTYDLLMMFLSVIFAIEVLAFVKSILPFVIEVLKFLYGWILSMLNAVM